MNGTKLSFVLDSGVSVPILFNLSDQDFIQISEVTFNGSGDVKPIQPLGSWNNKFNLGRYRK